MVDARMIDRWFRARERASEPGNAFPSRTIMKGLRHGG